MQPAPTSVKLPRMEALRVLRGRSIPTDPDHLPDMNDRDQSPEDALLASERDQAVRHAIGQLPVRCQKLLALKQKVERDNRVI